jgi:hypothetical protein
MLHISICLSIFWVSTIGDGELECSLTWKLYEWPGVHWDSLWEIYGFSAGFV